MPCIQLVSLQHFWSTNNINVNVISWNMQPYRKTPPHDSSIALAVVCPWGWQAFFVCCVNHLATMPATEIPIRLLNKLPESSILLLLIIMIIVVVVTVITLAIILYKKFTQFEATYSCPLSRKYNEESKMRNPPLIAFGVRNLCHQTQGDYLCQETWTCLSLSLSKRQLHSSLSVLFV